MNSSDNCAPVYQVKSHLCFRSLPNRPEFLLDTPTSFANSKEDWNNIFLARDIDGNEEEIGDSDSDYEDTPLAGMPVLSDNQCPR